MPSPLLGRRQVGEHDDIFEAAMPSAAQGYGVRREPGKNRRRCVMKLYGIEQDRVDRPTPRPSVSREAILANLLTQPPAQLLVRSRAVQPVPEPEANSGLDAVTPGVMKMG